MLFTTLILTGCFTEPSDRAPADRVPKDEAPTRDSDDVSSRDSPCTGDSGMDWVGFSLVDTSGAHAPLNGRLAVTVAEEPVDCEAWGDGSVRCGDPGRYGPVRVEADLLGFLPLEHQGEAVDDPERCNDHSWLGELTLESRECPEAEPVPAVAVTVLDGAGEPVAGAEVSAEHALTWSSRACEESGDSAGTYVCGLGMAGTVTVEAQSGSQSTREEVTVEHDGCSPITTTLTLRL